MFDNVLSSFKSWLKLLPMYYLNFIEQHSIDNYDTKFFFSFLKLVVTVIFIKRY